jgi:hypothetical protein
MTIPRTTSYAAVPASAMAVGGSMSERICDTNAIVSKMLQGGASNSMLGSLVQHLHLLATLQVTIAIAL